MPGEREEKKRTKKQAKTSVFRRFTRFNSILQEISPMRSVKHGAIMLE